jgi:hypothetical protein
MRKQKPFPDDVVLQVQKMQAEGHLDHEIQEYLVRSGTLTEWDAEVLVHQLNASRGKKPLVRRNWLIITVFNAIGLTLIIASTKHMYSIRVFNIAESILAFVLAVFLILVGFWFIEQGVEALISGKKYRKKADE